MLDSDKTKEQLVDELNALRQRVVELEAANARFVDIEKALKESEQEARLFHENELLSYQSLDEDGYLLEVNQTWLDTLGYSRDQVLGKWFGDFLTPGYQEHFKINFPRFKAAGEIHGVELEMVKNDGSRIIVALVGKIDHDQNGRFKKTRCVFQNITERKYSEENLQSTLPLGDI
ncbi:MAG: PAS domain-containing protein, partial [Deltaproteobacteria bacterium]|nr:PAS domain-containing protein [Deltaproteobacteria bacterium]